MQLKGGRIYFGTQVERVQLIMSGKAQWSSQPWTCITEAPQSSSNRIVKRELKSERGLGYDPQSMTCSDPLLPTWLHLLKIPQPPKTACRTCTFRASQVTN